MSDHTMVENNEEKNKENEAGGIFAVLAQYLKDFSFESPNAPQSLQRRETAPEISVEINVAANDLESHRYEVVLSIFAKAMEGEKTLFAAELVYGGVFHIEHIPEQHLPPLLFVECPRLLFPFARQILADATQQGGFPPLMLEPVDFASLFQQRAMEEIEQTRRPN